MRKTPYNKGFTLVESLVAVSILALAVTGPLLIAQKGIGSAIYSRDQITAYYLAEEAVEYVRNVRDTNRIGDRSWLGQFDDCKVSATYPQSRCRIDARYVDFDDPADNAIQPCDGAAKSSCPVLGFDTANNTYGYGYGYGNGMTATKFTRTVALDDTHSSKEAEIAVTISWSTGLFAPVRSFTVKEVIFDY
jgi:prepilin-type N-terminal cleavage/methylation domain-containing protein